MRKFLLLFLLMLLFSVMKAQESLVVVNLKNGTVIKGTLIRIDPVKEMTLKLSGIETTIPMSEIASIDATASDNPSKDTLVNVKEVADCDTLANYKGFLLAKGNNVYVYCEGKDYEKAGAETLRKLLKNDGFWNVVDRMQDAHFTINYLVSLRGRDQGYISVSSWRVQQSELIYGESTNETPSPNINIATKGYNKVIISLQKKIEKGEIPQIIKKKFTIE
jgi:small nuclear ribonucleoprotein (snRNP)-like protein